MQYVCINYVFFIMKNLAVCFQYEKFYEFIITIIITIIILVILV